MNKLVLFGFLFGINSSFAQNTFKGSHCQEIKIDYPIEERINSSLLELQNLARNCGIKQGEDSYRFTARLPNAQYLTFDYRKGDYKGKGSNIFNFYLSSRSNIKENIGTIMLGEGRRAIISDTGMADLLKLQEYLDLLLLYGRCQDTRLPIC